MRFIGGKSLIIPYIIELINSRTVDVCTISDLFAGSGVVSKEFKKHGYKVISNDLMYFSYVILKGTISINKIPKFKSFKGVDPIEYLNGLNLSNFNNNLKKLFIYENYSPKGNRKYFSEDNAIKIDLIRQQIEFWKNDNKINEQEYYYLMACLLEAVPYISNITGVYGAFLKHWDNRALKELKLKYIDVEDNSKLNYVYNKDINKIVCDVECDLAYFDPPYNQRQYLPNYHVLETIAKYDYPVIKGVTGLRDYTNQKSLYCKKGEVISVFEDLIKNTKSRYIILSYNTEGILTHEEICLILKKYGKEDTLYFEHLDYERYKNAKTNKNKELKEVLYFIEKEK